MVVDIGRWQDPCKDVNCVLCTSPSVEFDVFKIIPGDGQGPRCSRHLVCWSLTRYLQGKRVVYVRPVEFDVPGLLFVTE